MGFPTRKLEEAEEEVEKGRRDEEVRGKEWRKEEDKRKLEGRRLKG